MGVATILARAPLRAARIRRREGERRSRARSSRRRRRRCRRRRCSFTRTRRSSSTRRPRLGWPGRRRCGARAAARSCATTRSGASASITSSRCTRCPIATRRSRTSWPSMRMRPSTRRRARSRSRTAFALIGLYLVNERGFTGRQAQRAAHVLGRRRQQWPRFLPPARVGDITVARRARRRRRRPRRSPAAVGGVRVGRLARPPRRGGRAAFAIASDQGRRARFAGDARERARRVSLRIYQTFAGAARRSAAGLRRGGGRQRARRRSGAGFLRVAAVAAEALGVGRRPLGLAEQRAPSSASPAVPMNFTISGFFCCSAMKPARSVGCGSLGSSAFGILNLFSAAFSPWQVCSSCFVVLLVDARRTASSSPEAPSSSCTSSSRSSSIFAQSIFLPAAIAFGETGPRLRALGLGRFGGGGGMAGRRCRSGRRARGSR